MRATRLSGVLEGEDGSRWAITVSPRDGAFGLLMRPGYVDPGPIPIAKGITYRPSSLLSGGWTWLLDGVEAIRLDRLEERESRDPAAPE